MREEVSPHTLKRLEEICENMSSHISRIEDIIITIYD